MDQMTFRELHGIERDPNWPHVDGCAGECIGCALEDAVLQAGGTQGRKFLLDHLKAPAKAEEPKGKKK